jgi:sugar phosphate isomerase/epimerase
MGTTDRQDSSPTDPATVENQAERIVVSFRSPETDPDETDDWWIADSEWLQESMTEHTYRRYLRWAHAGPVTVGEEFEEFVNCGCASPEDVVLRVERVDGGDAIGSETRIDVVPRKAVVDGDVQAL